MSIINPYGTGQTDKNQRRHLLLKLKFNTLINVSDLPEQKDNFFVVDVGFSD